MKQKLLSIIVPCCNEAGNIRAVYKEIFAHVPRRYAYELIFVDDGSTDDTLAVIKKLARREKRVHYISFTRNFGHQYALKAGLDLAHGAAAISLDSDLEHPPKLIPEMISRWEKGAKIVYTKRLPDTYMPVSKRRTSHMFYHVINALSETKIEDGSADFRLLDRTVMDMISHSHESTLFLRGLVMWSGYPSEAIAYHPAHRTWGVSKYTYSKMVRLAVDAITSFSTVPLRLATVLGLAISLFSGAYALYAVLVFILDKPSVIIGWPSVIISVLFIGGLQLMILGIIGEYIGKIFLETKQRPLYIIKEKSL
jgi:dolichol-phosphate mannosyltransferase